MEKPAQPDDEPRRVRPGITIVPPRGAATVPEQVEGLGRPISSPVFRELTLADLRSSRRRRRVLFPLFLLLATCASTFFAGATLWQPYLVLDDAPRAMKLVQANWLQGLGYMAAVMAILLTHEMGHFLQALRYGVPASLPIFIPLPIAVTGTMGAVIGMEGSRANRKQLFDIGISGPIAGLMVALPVVWFGIQQAGITTGTSEFWPFGKPLVFDLMTTYLRPDLPAGKVLQLNPLLMAGWVGMLVTGLNMLPVGQLDGGHVIYGLFGSKACVIARSFVVAAVVFMLVVDQYTWLVMLVLVLLMGVDHPQSRDDHIPLGPVRYAIGLASLAIPIFCFTPIVLL